MAAKTVEETMVDWAREGVIEGFKLFSIRLDSTEESVETLEKIAGALHRMITEGYQTAGMPERPSKEEIWLWSTRLGAYLGKLITRFVGGKWIAKPHAEIGFGYAIPLANVNFFPIVKMNDRMTKGDSENLVEYYIRLKELVATDS